MRKRLLPLLVVLAIASPACAMAADWYTGERNGSSAGKAKPAFGVSIDASLAATSQNSLHVSVFGTIAPFAPMNETGIRMRIGGLAGSYKYISTAPGVGSVTGRETSGSLLGGYEWVMPGTTVSVFAGLEAQNRTLSKADPNNKVVGTSFGLKTALDFYSNPTPYTMVSGNFTFATNNSAYYARIKAGMAVTGQVFVGPEILFLGDSFYGQWRFGAHLTGIKMGALQFGVSGGYVRDQKNGGGGYGILDAQIRF